MSHLLCLNSRDNYPNKCPHICLHLTVKQLPTARGRDRCNGITPKCGRVLYRSPPLWQGLNLQPPLPDFPSELAAYSKRNHLKGMSFRATKPPSERPATAGEANYTQPIFPAQAL